MSNLKFILCLSSSVFLLGCTSGVDESLASAVNTSPSLLMSGNKQTTEAQQPQAGNKFETCVFEARSLLKINKMKYASEVDELFNTINDAKYYASVSAKVSGDVYRTITPYYKYRINDICNTVSHLLLNEFKDGLHHRKVKK